MAAVYRVALGLVVFAFVASVANAQSVEVRVDADKHLPRRPVGPKVTKVTETKKDKLKADRSDSNESESYDRDAVAAGYGPAGFGGYGPGYGAYAAGESESYDADRSEQQDQLSKESTKEVKVEESDPSEGQSRTGGFKNFDAENSFNKVHKFDQVKKFDEHKKYDKFDKFGGYQAGYAPYAPYAPGYGFNKFGYGGEHFDKAASYDKAEKYDKVEKFDQSKKYDKFQAGSAGFGAYDAVDKFDKVEKYDKVEKLDKSVAYDSYDSFGKFGKFGNYGNFGGFSPLGPFGPYPPYGGPGFTPYFPYFNKFNKYGKGYNYDTDRFLQGVYRATDKLGYGGFYGPKRPFGPGPVIRPGYGPAFVPGPYPGPFVPGPYGVSAFGGASGESYEEDKSASSATSELDIESGKQSVSLSGARNLDLVGPPPPPPSFPVSPFEKKKNLKYTLDVIQGLVRLVLNENIGCSPRYSQFIQALRNKVIFFPNY